MIPSSIFQVSVYSLFAWSVRWIVILILIYIVVLAIPNNHYDNYNIYGCARLKYQYA